MSRPDQGRIRVVFSPKISTEFAFHPQIRYSKNVKSIAVASYSFSRTPRLKEALEEHFPGVPMVWNETRQVLNETELSEFLKGHSHAIIGREPISTELLQQVPELEVISKYGVGLDGIDLKAMSQAGLKLGWTPGVNRTAVAELALTFMLVLIRKVHEGYATMRDGNWSRPVGAHQLSGKTVGIIGCGNVGSELIRILAPFQCRILVNDIRSKDPDYENFFREWKLQNCSLRDLLQEAEVVTLHTPKNKTTVGMIGRDELSLMKPSSILINTARGGLVDESALEEALRRGELGGAGLDVFEEEPTRNTRLTAHPLVYTTPHIGGASEEAVLAMGLAAIEGLSRPVDPLSLARYQ